MASTNGSQITTLTVTYSQEELPLKALPGPASGAQVRKDGEKWTLKDIFYWEGQLEIEHHSGSRCQEAGNEVP